MAYLKSIALLITLLFTVLGETIAQSYAIRPNDTISMAGMMEDLSTLTIEQVNTTSNTIILRWQKVSESVPANWEASVCDNQMCQTTLVDSGTMNPVLRSEYGLILLHITPHVNYGTCIVRYAVWDIASPSVKDTLTYILSMKETSEVRKVENKNEFSVFPNPVKNNLQIFSDPQQGSWFLITDILGKTVLNGLIESKVMTLSTDKLQNGFYSISFFDKSKNISTKKFIVQH